MPSRVSTLALWSVTLVLSQTLTAAGQGILSGRTRDALGNLLEGVEVLVLSGAQQTVPVAAAHTDREGRFNIRGLVPGSYRVAAVKQGYLTFVGEYDTLLERSLDLVLQPAYQLEKDGSGAPLPSDGAWVLRLPRRSLWREVESRSAAGEPAPEEDPGERLRFQLDQLFSVDSTSPAEPASSAELRATESSVKVFSGIGERGRLAVRGEREASGSTAPGSSAAALDRRSTAMTLDLAYAPHSGAELAVNAFYGAKQYEAASKDDVASLRQSQQAWGYDAIWSQKLGDKSRWALELDYEQASLGVGGEQASGSAAPHGEDLESRAMTAQGSFERLEDERHELQVAMRAQHARWPTLSALTGTPGGQGAPSSWNLQVEAQDSWTVAAPLKLIYGLSCKQALDSARDATLIVPRLGGALAWEGISARASMSYHAVAGSGGVGGGALDPFRPLHKLGYDAEVELPVGSGVHLEGGTRYTPIQFDVTGRPGVQGGFDPQPLYVTDGNAGVLEHRLSVVGQTKTARTSLEVARGRAQGALAPLMPFGAPVALAESELRYQNARFGLHLPATGTQVQLEYSRAAASANELADESLQQAVELRLAQDVWGLKARAEWRLLVALELGSIETAALADWLERDGDARALDALNRRLSAGVSVAF